MLTEFNINYSCSHSGISAKSATVIPMSPSVMPVLSFVIPAKAGIQLLILVSAMAFWIPAFAGMAVAGFKKT